MFCAGSVLGAEPLSNPAKQPVSLGQGHTEVKGDAPRCPLCLSLFKSTNNTAYESN